MSGPTTHDRRVQMAEIKSAPIVGIDDQCDDVVCFNSEHTLADIVRWIMTNRSEAEEIFRMLASEIEKPDLLN